MLGRRLGDTLLRTRTPLSTFVVLAVLALPLISHAPSTSGAEEKASARHGKSSSPDALRALPLLADNGPVRTAFPAGEGLGDPDKVREVAASIADEAGIGESIDLLWSGLDPEYFYRANAAANPDGSYPGETVPYDYPALEPFLESITPDVAEKHAADLIELSSLLTLAALHTSETPTPPTPFFQYGLAAAQSIAAKVSEHVDSCDARLTYAYLVGLGEAPRRKNLERVFQDSVNACPDDSTARWVWGHRLINDSVVFAELVKTMGSNRPEVMQDPVDFFETWLRDEPGSVLAEAGLADTHLTQALAMRDEQVAPFTVRAYLTSARAGYRTANEAAPHSEFVVGEASAAALLGDEAALDLVDGAIDDRPRSLSFRQAGTLVHEALRDFEGAAADAAADADSVDGLRLVANRYGFDISGWVGFSDASMATLPDATEGDYGAGSVDWLGFIPDYRADGLVSSSSLNPSCRQLALRRNLVLSGQADAARQVDIFTDDLGNYVENGPSDHHCGGYFVDALGAVNMEEFGYDEDVSYDDAQNLWRYAGNLTKARALVNAWIESSPSDSFAYQRLGEINFLETKYVDAAEAFKTAAEYEYGEEYRDWNADNSGEAELMLGLANEKAGKATEALAAYQFVVDQGPRNVDDIESTASSNNANAESRIAAILTDQGHQDEALVHFEAAANVAVDHDKAFGEVTSFDVLGGGVPTSGAEENNYAVALLAAGKDPEKAYELSRWALVHDPKSPVFLDTLAQAQEASGRTDDAEKTYAEAAAADATVYQSQNNKGVLAARDGRYDDAEAALGAAVRAKPDYALGWFNLGLVLAHSKNPADFFRSQGAIAKAVRLDSDFRGADQTFQTDLSAVSTKLDISRPVALGWTFTSTAQTPATGLGWMVVVIALLRLLLALGVDRVFEVVGVKVFSSQTHAGRWWSTWWHRLNTFTGAIVAVLGCGVVAAWPFLGSATTGFWAVATTLVLTLALIWLFVTATRPLPASGVSRQGWAPGMLLGGITALVGYAFVPVPVDRREALSWRERWSGVILLAILTVTGLAIGVTTGVPLVRVVGVAALAMLSSAMLPVKPFDGGFLRGRATELAVSVSLLVVASGIVSGWL